MTQPLDEPRSVSRPSGGIISAEREVSLPVAGPGRIERPTHPAVPRLTAGRLHFAPAPVKDAAQPAAPVRPSNRAERAFEAGWVSLLAACAMECAWRLL